MRHEQKRIPWAYAAEAVFAEIHAYHAEVVEFGRFDERMKKLADHIRQANDDVEKIHVTGGKITQQFQRIEAAEIDDEPAVARVVRLADNPSGRNQP